MVPAAAHALIQNGHHVVIEKNAGVGSGLPDKIYSDLGCEIVDTADEVWARSDMIVKVKEPLAPEYDRMRENQLLYTYLHLAAEPELTQALLDRKVSGVAYETIEVNGGLPLLKPMSEVAGRMAIQVGAWCLEKHQGQKHAAGRCSRCFEGQSGHHWWRGCGNQRSQNGGRPRCRRDHLGHQLESFGIPRRYFGGRVHTLFSTPHHVAHKVTNADLVVGAVLIHGARAPKLVTRDMLSNMEDGTALVDVAVDQGGCVETMKVTTHDNPTFVVDGVLHYGVANMPGAVARTSTFALANATLPAT